MNIGQRLNIGFLLITFLVVAVGGMLLINLRRVVEPLREDIPTHVNRIVETSYLDGLAQFILYYDEVLRQSARSYVYSQGEQWQLRYREVEPRLKAMIKEAIERGDREDKTTFAIIHNANNELVRMERNSMRLVGTGRTQEAVSILESKAYLAQKEIYEKNLRGYVIRRGTKYGQALRASTNSVQEAVKTAQEELRLSIRLLLTFGIGALVFSLVIADLVTRSIVEPVKKLTASAVSASRGDYNITLEAHSRDELGVLAATFNQMFTDLKKSGSTISVRTKDLEDKTKELERIKHELEDIVTERTQELRRGQTAMLYMVEDLNRHTRELREAQERLIRSEKLAALGKLAGIVGHELRNPLGVLRNSLYFLKMKIADVSQNEKIKRHMSIMNQEINIADRIITDILAFGRIKEPRPEKVDIGQVINRALTRLKVSEAIELVKKIEPDLPFLSADGGQLEQVFVNIILNALQAMPEGGTLTISVAKEDTAVEITVSDTGVGIPEEDHHKIFEPLYSTKIKGTGLGLSLCQSVINLHKGSISIKSDTGKGTHFVIHLPVSKETASGEGKV